jgi:parvulin-like peptidyl-prolyl isomerase
VKAGTTPEEKAQGEAKQDPDRPQPTPAERLAALQRDKERLQSEIEFVRTKVKQTIPMLQDKLKMKRPEFRSIDAGTGFQAAPVAEMRKARFMSEDEKKPLHDALMTVGGRPVSRTYVNDMLGYLQTFPAAGPEESRTQRVMWEVIRTEAVRSSFGEGASEAESEIQTLYSQLVDGKAKFEDLAKQRPQSPGGEKGGVIEPVTRNSHHGLRVEQIAFTTPEGQISRPFATMRGFAILRADKVHAAANPDEAKVDASMLFVPFHADPEQVNKALGSVTMGNVEIAVFDEAAMKMLPAFFQPQPQIPNQPDAQKDADAGKIEPDASKKKEPEKKEPEKKEPVKQLPVKQSADGSKGN